eukprot:1912610-Rhodomonas_salina.2
MHFFVVISEHTFEDKGGPRVERGGPGVKSRPVSPKSSVYLQQKFGVSSAKVHCSKQHNPGTNCTKIVGFVFDCGARSCAKQHSPGTNCMQVLAFVLDFVPGECLGPSDTGSIIRSLSTGNRTYAFSVLKLRSVLIAA